MCVCFFFQLQSVHVWVVFMGDKKKIYWIYHIKGGKPIHLSSYDVKRETNYWRRTIIARWKRNGGGHKLAEGVMYVRPVH